MFSVFLSSYRNTRESLGELEKAVETLASGSCSHSISPKLSLVFSMFSHMFSMLQFTYNYLKAHRCSNTPGDSVDNLLFSNTLNAVML